MLPTPTKYTVVAGASEGATELNAFDGALLKAGIGNVNLVRVSSILPPGATFVEKLVIPPGSLVPVAYASITCEEKGEVIAAAVGVGYTAGTFGVIMEFSGHCTKEQAEATIEMMLKDAFERRGMKMTGMKVIGSEHRVERAGCAFAAIPMWY
ncbi:MAG: arginine decarboxylase, pyruvoyl-dependent [Firmicutes bacterium]|nr:arginine decarboxylase, pyruvoyl-dependent [Bacillota bacterium]